MLNPDWCGRAGAKEAEATQNNLFLFQPFADQARHQTPEWVVVRQTPCSSITYFFGVLNYVKAVGWVNGEAILISVNLFVMPSLTDFN